MTIKGKEVLPRLAETYQQLYIVPGRPESSELYTDIVLRGKDSVSKDLSHFLMNDEDRCEMMQTPAGAVLAVTLHERKDFELFLQIMANKCVPYDVPATQGASILDGLINWNKIKAHKKAWISEQTAAGVIFPDWGEEFKQFTAVKDNFKDALIILSTGPYSNIPADKVGLETKEWNRLSVIIRQYHECTHFVCRRKYPEQVDAVWDEVIADAAGIIGATGKMDIFLEKIFLGIDENGYTGGRLENYVNEDVDIDKLAVKICGALKNIEELYKENSGLSPFEFALMLKADCFKT